jgi:hypothetical protein
VANLLLEQPLDKIPCRIYRHISKINHIIYYPLFTSFPYYASMEKRLEKDFYDYKILSRYATNSGTAGTVANRSRPRAS